MVASVMDEELLFMEQRLACELDGDRTRWGGARDPRRCDELEEEWLNSQAGDKANLEDVLDLDDHG